MAIDKQLAREQTISLNGTQVLGVKSIELSGSKNDAKTTDFASAGWERHIPVSRSRSAKVEGYFMEDAATGARDPGQAAAEALAAEIGPDSRGTWIITSPGGMQASFQGTCNITASGGGGTDDTSPWACDITVSGTITYTQT